MSGKTKYHVILAMNNDIDRLAEQEEKWESSIKTLRTPQERNHARFMLSMKQRELQAAHMRKFRYMEGPSSAISTKSTPSSASQPTGPTPTTGVSKIGQRLLALARSLSD